MVQGTGTKVSYSASASASVSGYTDGGYNCVASKLIDGDTSTYYLVHPAARRPACMPCRPRRGGPL